MRVAGKRSSRGESTKVQHVHLSARERKFVVEFLVDCDAGAAYRRAGYTAANPNAPAARLLRRAEIVDAIMAQNALHRSQRVSAESALDPVFQGAITAKGYGERAVGVLDHSALWNVLRSSTSEIEGKDLARGVRMLAIQAHTLDGIYNSLVRDALDAEWLSRSETLLKLAFRAQSQCRATWETIALVQNPPLASYVKQANIAHGHQQVNNAPAIARARDRKSPSKLLDKTNHEPDDWMDRRAPQATGRDHSPVEAMDEFDGAQVGARQGSSCEERVQAAILRNVRRSAAQPEAEVGIRLSGS
jgi:hypothetical protein